MSYAADNNSTDLMPGTKSEAVPTAERRASLDCRSLTDAELLAAVTGLSIREAKRVHRLLCAAI